MKGGNPTQPPDIDSSSHSPALRLVSLSTATPQEHPLATRKTRVGSDPESDFEINRFGVSRHHAVIRRRGSRYFLSDLGSTNGTFVNGARIRHPVRIGPGDEIGFGAARFAVVGNRPRSSRARIGFYLGGCLAVVLALALAGLQFARNWQQLLQGVDTGSTMPIASAAATPSQRAIGKLPEPKPDRKASDISAASMTPDSVIRKGSAPPPAPARVSAASVAGSQWIERINWYRAMLKLPPIGEKPDLSEGDVKHAEYLVRNYAGAIRSGTDHGIDAHVEDAKNQWYSAEGNAAAAHSDFDYIWGTEVAPTPASGIDRWISGAFHRMLLLNPALESAGYGLYCQDAFCIQSLDVNDGEEDRARWNITGALQFPPPDAAVPIGALAGESPSPLTACPGYTFPVGIPVTLELGMHVKADLTSYSIARRGASGEEPLEACGYNGWAYGNENPAEQLYVAKEMLAFGAVVVIPRKPLLAGERYQVDMQVSGHDYRWSFAVGTAGLQSASSR